jgi:hypothetical protein
LTNCASFSPDAMPTSTVMTVMTVIAEVCSVAKR